MLCVCAVSAVSRGQTKEWISVATHVGGSTGLRTIMSEGCSNVVTRAKGKIELINKRVLYG